jgi:AraC-like DNA-binding protein
MRLRFVFNFIAFRWSVGYALIVMSYEDVVQTGRTIFGRLGQDGFVWIRHDVKTWPDFWERNDMVVHRGMIWLSIVILGAAEFCLTKKTAVLAGGMIGGSGSPAKLCCLPVENIPVAEFVTLALAKDSLPALMGPLRGDAIPHTLSRVVDGKLPKLTCVSSNNLGVNLIKLAEELFSPPGPAFTHPLFFQAKALEALSILAGATPVKGRGLSNRSLRSDANEQQGLVSGGPSTRKEQLARTRAAKAQQIISENLEEPLNLAELGRRVGCSPYYLSRTFSACAGCTLQEYQRRTRLHRAAELLRGGRHNVTEAALAVGYSSFSYFTKAFRETFGCCPGLYPVVGTRLARSDSYPRSG